MLVAVVGFDFVAVPLQHSEHIRKKKRYCETMIRRHSIHPQQSEVFSEYVREKDWAVSKHADAADGGDDDGDWDLLRIDKDMRIHSTMLPTNSEPMSMKIVHRHWWLILRNPWLRRRCC